MKKLVFAGVALAALASTAAVAQQGPGPRQAQPLTRAALESRIDAAFVRLDANRDGFVTQDEARARAEAGRADRRAHRGERREARAERKAERFARLDANRDGAISRAEFDAPRARGNRAERREARAERRADRRGFRAERRGGGQGGGGMFARLGGRQFEAADANRDGRVSREEARNGALALFARIDTDRDGTISVDERRAAREAFRGQRQGRRS
jgi:Ca2+-binding EF-hand superfamily protein